MTDENRKKRDAELTPEEQALGPLPTHTAGMPENSIEGEAVTRDPRDSPDSARKHVNMPADDEQQVLEQAVDEGVEQADDDQRYASD